MSDQGRRHRIALMTFDLPEFFTRLRVIRDDPFKAARDDFGLLAIFDDQRCRPARLHIAWHSPGFFAGLFIDPDDERLLPFVFVALESDDILGNHGGRARTHSDACDFADSGLPQQLAAQGIAVQTVALSAEPDIDILTVGCRRRRGVTALAMAIVIDRTL